MIALTFLSLLVAVTGTLWAGPRLGRASFAVMAVPPGVATVTGAAALGGETVTAEWTWVPGLDLTFAFAITPFAALFSILVGGIGVLVLAYAAGYVGPRAVGNPRFAALLGTFAVAMVGLVWSDGVWTFFLFWEATSLISFSLVGFKTTSSAAAVAARRALAITATGGLVLLAGLLVLADATGTDRLSEMGPVTTTSAAVAAALIVIAAATKSAQVPFHVWLPGAMAAPTPVSAYLHSATLVKAGVLLVAVTAPILSEADPFRPLVLGFGLASMLWGAVGALRHHDAKLVLAWGTISQLGLMMVLLGAGSAKATFAAVALVVAHALFKSALFMTVGEIDTRTGSRDIRELSGLGRAMPVTAITFAVAAASMAGLPFLLGFMAKEAALEATLGLDGSAATWLTALVTLGSTLTVAYTTRLGLGLFTGPPPSMSISARRPLMETPAALLAAAGVLGYVAADALNGPISDAATHLDPDAVVYELIQVPPLGAALSLSLVAIVVGGALGWFLHTRSAPAPRPLGADAVDATLDDLPRFGARMAARVQHGSLPGYVGTTVAAAGLAALPLLGVFDSEQLTLSDSGGQLVATALVIVSALAATRVRSRMGAALVLGSVGLSMSALFLAYGAPDLALTQLLVETIVVVGFVLALSPFTSQFAAGARVRRRLALSVGAALVVGLALAGAQAEPVGERPTDELVAAAVDDGGGNNVVNVILTDMRALDTLFEVVVLVIVAVGVVTLAGVRRDQVTAPEPDTVSTGGTP